MTLFKKIIISLIAALALISCGKSGDSKKSKSSSNKSLLSTWEGDIDNEGSILRLGLDLTKAVVNSKGNVLITLTEDSITLVCSGNAELTGSSNEGYIQIDPFIAKSFTPPVTQAIADSRCNEFANEINKSNNLKGAQYLLNNGTLKLCNNDICIDLN
ncbi:hypothetical protein ACWNT8_10690 [Pigmentibacter ruber]|nr:hypothetical protein GTC16762_18520 [Pigmentibacter ruber]